MLKGYFTINGFLRILVDELRGRLGFARAGAANEFTVDDEPGCVRFITVVIGSGTAQTVEFIQKSTTGYAVGYCIWIGITADLWCR